MEGKLSDLPPPYSPTGPQVTSPPPPQPVQPLIINPPQITLVPAHVVVASPVGPTSCQHTCRSCHALISTRVERKPSTKTHCFAFLLCIFGCWPCVCLPYCTDSCLNTDHYCPNCNAFLGSYSS